MDIARVFRAGLLGLGALRVGALRVRTLGVRVLRVRMLRIGAPRVGVLDVYWPVIMTRPMKIDFKHWHLGVSLI